jgi:putative endonuclease
LRAKLPIKLVYFEKHRTKSAALKREAAIKRLARAKKLSLTRAGGPEKRVNWL